MTRRLTDYGPPPRKAVTVTINPASAPSGQKARLTLKRLNTLLEQINELSSIAQIRAVLRVVIEAQIIVISELIKLGLGR